MIRTALGRFNWVRGIEHGLNVHVIGIERLRVLPRNIVVDIGWQVQVPCCHLVVGLQVGRDDMMELHP